MDKSTFIFRGIRSNFSFLFHFSMEIMSANRIHVAPDGTPGLFCLPMTHKEDVWLIWVNKLFRFKFDHCFLDGTRKCH